MRSIASLIAIGFFAFAFVSFAKYSDGLVLFRGFGFEVEFSLTIFVIFQIAFIVFLYIGLKIVSFVLGSKRRVLIYLKTRQEKKEVLRLRVAVNKLVTLETASLYKEAKKNIRENVEVSKEMLLVAARAAHVERHYSDRDTYIAQLELNDGDDIWLAKALMLLDEGRHHDTLAVLQKIQKRNVSSVRAELEALRLGRNWKQVLLLIKDVRKLDAMSADDCHHVELDAILGLLADKDVLLTDAKRLLKEASKRVRGEARFVLAMSKAFFLRGETVSAQDIVEDYLNSNWDDALVKQYVRVSDSQNLSALEKMESWLVKQPRNPRLLMALGVMCRERELWGKSESYFRASDALNASAEVAYELSKLYSTMSRLEESKEQLELFAVRQDVDFQ
ncbi:hypothetical protein N8Z26_01705 [Burkholderiales bacterium]|nr:hypothetical protein [Burkholderiales bacterium]